MNRSLLLALAACALSLTACDGAVETPDAGADGGTAPDSGPRDAGGPPPDSGPPPDGGPPTPTCTAGCEFVELALGSGHSCARRENGEVWCWGNNEQGQLGDGTSRHENCAPVGVRPVDCSSTPVQVRARAAGMATEGLPDVRQLSSEAGRSSCVVRSTNELWCWGHVLTSMGMRAEALAAIRVEGFGGVVQASDGGSHLCMVQGTDLQVVCYGSNDSRQLGTAGSINDLFSPMLTEVVQDPEDPTRGLHEVETVTVGGDTSCALRGGQVWCWGTNRDGQLGDGLGSHDEARCGLAGMGELYDCSSVPVQVGGADPLRNVVQVAAGVAHVCALDSDGEVWCWGDNRAGQAGQPRTTESLNVPTRVEGLTSESVQVAEIDAAGRFTCARLSNGTVRCWGFNLRGQLGDGMESHGTTCRATTAEQGDCSETPVEVSGITDATALSAGGQHACVLRASGEAWCWGYNDTRQLGDGTRETRYLPVRVARLP